LLLIIKRSVEEGGLILSVVVVFDNVCIYLYIRESDTTCTVIVCLKQVKS